MKKHEKVSDVAFGGFVVMLFLFIVFVGGMCVEAYKQMSEWIK